MTTWGPLLSHPDRDPILSKIFSYLSVPDVLELQVLNKIWREAILEYKLNTCLPISGSTLREFESTGQNLHKLFENEYIHKYKIIVNGWDHICNYIPQKFYDELFDKPNPVKKLVLRGRGIWDSCRCPANSNSSIGTLVDNIPKDKFTQLEVLVIDESFTISSCALLDMIARSPKLKMLSFSGRIRKHDHVKPFQSQVIHSSIERIYWPFPAKKDALALNFIVKSNNIRTIHSSMEIICDLLSSDSLPLLKNLSLNLIEDWSCPKKDLKRAYQNVERVKHLGLAKRLEALEVRTFPLGEVCSEEDEETYRNAERYFETYKLTFWDQVSKMTKLKYLCIFGAWDLEGICSALSKHGLGIEYFHTNCVPTSVMEALDDEDTVVLQMNDAIRDLRNLTSLRSLHFHCADKMFNIDVQTVQGFKDLIDKIWIMNFKTRWTPEVEDFLYALMKRGNQSGKLYSVDVLIQPKDIELADILMTLVLKFPSEHNMKSYVTTNAEKLIKDRYKNCSILSLNCWGVRLIDVPRDRSSYESIKLIWNTYKNIFNPSSYGC